MTDAVKARLMLVGLCLAWGLTWPAMRLGLVDFPPFAMRATSVLIGAASLFVLAVFVGRPVKIPPRSLWGYIAIVSLLNIIVFSICVAFAQLHTMTGRVAILVYTMPIWASLMSWFALGERLNKFTLLAFGLCCAGMAVLVYPLAQGGIPIGIFLSLAAAFSWALGTIYIKKSHKSVDPYTLSTLQLAFAFVVMIVLTALFEQSFEITHVGWKAWAGVAFAGFFGSAIAYYLWFHIISLLPTSTASLGALSSPVIGLISSIFLLDEVPTGTDIVGFALMFSASFIALLSPQTASPREQTDRS